MFRNHLLVAIRNMLRNKAIALIHVCGFGLGLAAFLFAAQTVILEYSFDDFHGDRKKIFSASTYFKAPKGQEDYFLSSVPALYHRIKAEMPEVRYVARYMDQSNREPYCVMTYNTSDGIQKSYNETSVRYVDEDFLRIFDFPFIEGNRRKALLETTSIVLTESIARKYFGDDDPIGKVVTISTGGPETKQTKFTYHVTAVLKDVPDNSSLRFEILLPFRNFEEPYHQDVKNIWNWPGFFTFLKTKEVQIPEALTTKINGLVPAEERKKMTEIGLSMHLKVEPFAQFHFSDGRLDSDSPPVVTNNATYTFMIGLIGFAILIVASVNYINLTTAKSLNRAKEVGIRKVVGASFSQLIRQFLLDAFLVNVIGFLFALTLLQLAAPLIEMWTGSTVMVFNWSTTQIVLVILVMSVSVLVNGIVPAFFLTGIEPVKALRGYSLRFDDGGMLRKGLVVFQFVVSVALIIFTFTIFLQLDYLRSRQKGFQSDHRIIINNVGTEDFNFQKFRAFKERLLMNRKILHATAAMGVPGAPFILASAEFSNAETPHERVRMRHNVVDYDFATTLGIEVVAGREFTIDRTTDEKCAILNESAVKALGLATSENAVGKTVMYYWGGIEGTIELKIVGVVRDVSNTRSPGRSALPEMYMFANTAWPYGVYNFYIIHVAPNDIQETVELLEQEWENIFPQAPFEYTFQDQVFQRLFQRDERIRSIAGISTGLSVLIACMGLAGLVAFSVSRRIKEIGIRKTLGASISQVLLLLSSEFILLILVAIVVAIPIARFAVKQFLENYEYRIELSVWTFLIPCLLLLLIAIVTISYQTIRAAKSDPVKALRYE